MSTSHNIKDVSILSEGWLDLVHKEVDVRTKPMCKNFGDEFENDIKETNRSELTDHRSTFFSRNDATKA